MIIYASLREKNIYNSLFERYTMSQATTGVERGESAARPDSNILSCITSTRIFLKYFFLNTIYIYAIVVCRLNFINLLYIRGSQSVWRDKMRSQRQERNKNRARALFRTEKQKREGRKERKKERRETHRMRLEFDSGCQGLADPGSTLVVVVVKEQPDSPDRRIILGIRI